MSDEQTTAEVTEATDQATTAAAQAPDLTVTDLQALKSIIDVASQRGAFKPNEMMTVGQTYNKLDAFLGAVTANQQPPQGA